MKKDAPVQAAEDRSPSPHCQRDDSSSLMHNILERFDGLETYVGERFDSLERQVDTRFKEMNSRIAKVEENVTIIRDCLDLPPPPSV